MQWNNIELFREKVYDCEKKRIDINAYWDSHGKAIPWARPPAGYRWT